MESDDAATAKIIIPQQQCLRDWFISCFSVTSVGISKISRRSSSRLGSVRFSLTRSASLLIIFPIVLMLKNTCWNYPGVYIDAELILVETQFGPLTIIA